MKRRNLMRSMGVIGLGTVTPSTVAGADEDNEGLNMINASEVDSHHYDSLRRKLKDDEEVSMLIEKAENMGWSPNWNEATAKTKEVETESKQGSFDTLVLPFDHSGNKEEDEYFRLIWNGNDTFGIDDAEPKHFDHVSKGANIVHISDNSQMLAESGSKIIEAASYDIRGNEVISETTTIEEDDDDDVGTVAVLPASNDYCTIQVRAVDFDDGITCLSADCIVSALGIDMAAILGCLTGFSNPLSALLCAYGAGIALWEAGSCISCPSNSVEVNISESWLEENVHEPDPPLYPHPCAMFNPNAGQELPLPKCDLEDIPTEEDYNYPDC
ncbi:hypothetical protein [Natrarchaeobius halalkaliphilus]|uniref:hypothetical protein n=1 Tax=Natrarchaeobius halalkaliphilus TaxID=1679091 RepID=UPI000F542E6A|nr:hypothetical protein [Natrarchaeobius halalkaliphilus]